MSTSTSRSYKNDAAEDSGSLTALHNPFDSPPRKEQQLYDDSHVSRNLFVRRPSDTLHPLADYGPSDRQEADEVGSGYDEYWEDEDEEDENRFVNFALLSHMAVQLRDKVPRGIHVKGSIPYPRTFTGKNIVVNTC
jgi:hypothetical protein